MTYCNGCNNRIKEMPFNCKFCGHYHCGDHRLPENHHCTGLRGGKRFNGFKRNTSTHKSIAKTKTTVTLVVIVSIIALGILVQITSSQDDSYSAKYEAVNLTNVDSYPKEANITLFDKKNSKEIDATLFNKSYEYEFEDKTYNVELELSRNKYGSYSGSLREYTYSGYLPDDWETHYYELFINKGDDEELIREIIGKIRDNPEIKSEEDELKAVVSFVQSIPYDYGKLNDPDWKTNYPYETVYENKGVCQDVSILLIKLLKELGYDVVGFIFDAADHMGVGVRCPRGYGNFGTDYCFIEATDVTRIGYVPEEYGIYGGITLDESPEVIRFGGTKIYNGIIEDKKEQEKLIKIYGEDYLSMSKEQRKLTEQMTSIEDKLDRLDLEYRRKGCEGVVYIGTAKARACDRLYREINGYVDDYNKLVTEFNDLIDNNLNPSITTLRQQ